MGIVLSFDSYNDCLCVFFCFVWQLRVQAIRGLPLLCKDTPEHLPKIADVLGQLLLAGKTGVSSGLSFLLFLLLYLAVAGFLLEMFWSFLNALCLKCRGRFGKNCGAAGFDVSSQAGYKR